MEFMTSTTGCSSLDHRQNEYTLEELNMHLLQRNQCTLVQPQHRHRSFIGPILWPEEDKMKILRSVVGYTGKGQIRNTKIMEKLNILNLNNKLLKSRPQWKYYSINGKEMNSKENFNIQPNKMIKHRVPIFKERATHSSRGQNMPSMA